MFNFDKFNAIVDKHSGLAVTGLWVVTPFMIFKTRKNNRILGDILLGAWGFGSYGAYRKALQNFKAKQESVEFKMPDLENLDGDAKEVIEAFGEFWDALQNANGGDE